MQIRKCADNKVKLKTCLLKIQLYAAVGVHLILYLEGSDVKSKVSKLAMNGMTTSVILNSDQRLRQRLIKSM